MDPEREGPFGRARFGPFRGRRVHDQVAAGGPENELGPERVPPDIGRAIVQTSPAFVVHLGGGRGAEALGELDEYLAWRLVLEIALVGAAVFERGPGGLCPGGRGEAQPEHEGRK